MVSVTLVERSEIMLGFARRTMALKENAWLAERVSIIGADVALRGDARRTAGLGDDAFDWVILNPPFNDPSDRLTPDPLRAEAHAMSDGEMFEHWLRTAGAVMKPGGQVSIIARPRSIRPILDALAGRFGGVEVTPVHPRADEEAIRILVTAVKQSRASLNFQPPLVIHDGPAHSFSPRMNELNNGEADLPRRRATRLSR
jgi:tRNA1(Val) A37 N6-methylase TrmN6